LFFLPFCLIFLCFLKFQGRFFLSFFGLFSLFGFSFIFYRFLSH
jgi:hypothetical protein